MVSKLFLLLLSVLVALSAAAPTQYTMRYGKHDLRRESGGHRRVAAGSANAAELARLVRRRARHVSKLRAVRVARERRARAQKA